MYSYGLANWRRRAKFALIILCATYVLYAFNAHTSAKRDFSIAKSYVYIIDVNQTGGERINGSALLPCILNDTVDKSLLKSVNHIDFAVKRVKPGGSWSPEECHSETSTVVIVPFRRRHKHLSEFLPHMHAFLQTRRLDYVLVVAQQTEDGLFNKARLMNAAYEQLKRLRAFDCYVFHDVDLLPIDERMSYECSPKGPVHMAVAIDKFRYRLPYYDNFGGVVGYTGSQFELTNGFSNRYYGWGAEDDDANARVRLSGQVVQRPPLKIGRYRSFRHGRDRGNPKNPKKDDLNKETEKIWKTDGLNSLNYTLVSIEKLALYTNITILID